MEVYARVRRAVQVDGMSVRRAAREFDLSRKTIRKMLAFSVPPGYQRKKPVKRPKLGPWLGVVDQILEDDESRPKKQRHTARRIYDRLKEEHAFTGGYTVVKDYVRDARLRHKEVGRINLCDAEAIRQFHAPAKYKKSLNNYSKIFSSVKRRMASASR